MAVAIATCTCATCGATFERRTTKFNRQEADSWADWAVQNYKECPACYGKRMRAEEEATPVHGVLTVSPLDQTFSITLRGNTYPFKDEAKRLGFRWTEAPCKGLLGALATKAPRKAWVLSFPADQLEAEVARIQDAGLEIKSDVADVDIAALQQVAEMDKSREAAQ